MNWISSMKLKSVLSLIILGLTTYTFPQVQFTEHIITTNAEGAWSVYAIDLDGDKDMDVLSASRVDDKIAWYENDGNENFTEHIISTSHLGPQSVYAADIGDDNDIDVLSAANGSEFGFLSDLVWYENNGNQYFTPHMIPTNSIGEGDWSVLAIDLDDDGDMDILSASHTDDKIA